MAMGDWFAIEELFTLGLGCDIAGAWLLAQGLLLTSRQIRRIESGVSETLADLTNQLIDDKIAGRFGRGGLMVGFVLQIVGYTVALGTDTTTRSSAVRVIVALLATALGAALVFGIYYWRREGRIKAETIAVASLTPQGAPMDRPDGRQLALMAIARYDIDRPLDESFAAFALRIWGADNATEPDLL
jgi:hypothetical protein